MKKKIILISSIVLVALCLLSTIVLIIVNNKKTKLSNFEQLVQNIYASEELLAGYDESIQMTEGTFPVYMKDTTFTIQRGDKVKSEVTTVEKKLSPSGTNTYDETITSYKTVDDVKYVELNGKVYQNTYTVPTYYLTFVLSDEFLESNYNLERDDDDFKLTAKVLDNKISSLFLNKSVGTIKNLNIEITVEDNLLKSFVANYETTNGFKVVINTTYKYGTVGTAKAVFYLEGGICQNTNERVSYLYSFDGTQISTLIVDPNVLETDPQDQIVKNGYHIEGWYQTKIENPDGTVEYADKWDFAKDKMTLDGVTLYAKWEINRLYTYELYYLNAKGEEVLLDSYEVKEGEKFNDLFLDNKTVEGYTSLGYLDATKEEWDTSFTHPGGDEDLAIKVYLNLIEGEYTVVKTKRQFKSALSKGENIYLMSDIDYDDEMCFDSYSGTILGNNHTISNVEIDYDTSKSGLQGSLDDLKGTSDHLYIALFFELKNATIKDLKFENVLIDINTNYSQIKYLVVAPLAIVASNTTIENVTMTGRITFTKTPNSENEIVLNDFFYSKDSDVTVNANSKVEISE